MGTRRRKASENLSVTTRPDGLGNQPRRPRVTAPVTDDDSTAPSPTANAQVTVYWRPGCPFCAMLRAGLRRHDVQYTEVNIWDDPEAAAFVRSVARGNETVPTVTVGTVSLVNPSAREVAALVGAAMD